MMRLCITPFLVPPDIGNQKGVTLEKFCKSIVLLKDISKKYLTFGYKKTQHNEFHKLI